MSEDVWSEQDTDPDAIEAALRALLRTRHAENQALIPARVLNLVVIVDRDWKGEVANRLQRVGRYQASRTILCGVQQGRTTLDAVATVSYEEPGAGSVGVVREQIEIDLGPEHLEALDTVVDPILVSELPTIVWSPHGYTDAVNRLLPVTDVILLDSDDLPEPAEAFERAGSLCDRVYVVDLAWLRTTPWRERLAASFDLRERAAALSRVSELEICHQESSTASGLLLSGWLASRLGWEPVPLAGVPGQELSGSLARPDGEVRLRLQRLSQDAPGLGGVTVEAEPGLRLSLSRGRGGLDAEETDAEGERRHWKILGASRGEGGILGEGVRQALLRDPTYPAALWVARELCPV
ncbi:MAG TPA: glucose-6-phosphate dehydrogenase assembly protein OpcA [Solirubrobacteraceae bacterium]